MKSAEELSEETKGHLEDCMRAFVQLVNKLNALKLDPRWRPELHEANIQLARARTFARTGQVPPNDL